VLVDTPPLEIVPPVVGPPELLKEHPQNNRTATRAATGAEKRTPTMRELRPGYSFLMKSSCLHLSLN
jgi:hypothetical protein